MKKISIKKLERSIDYKKLEELSSRSFENGEITVSILCLCFNHRPYIKRCIDMFLKQKVDFNVEILIHDDASNDGSIEILREYERRYPKIIKVIYEVENQYSKGINIENVILSNYIAGKYVAICEGDDYWLDPLKLAFQVKSFELFPDASFSVHKVLNQSAKGNIIGCIPHAMNSSVIFERSEIVPRIIKSYTFHTTSYMFKSNDYLHYCHNLPKFATHLKVGDYGLQLFFSNIGQTIYLDKTMSVHVDNVPGSWTEKSRNANIKQLREERNNIIGSLKLFDQFTDFEFHRAFLERSNKAKTHELYANGCYEEILNNKYYRRALFKYDRRSLISVYLIIKHPKLYKLLKAWKQKTN